MNEHTTYTPAKVWTWDDENDAITGNRPTSGARFEQDLPVGDHAYQLYSQGTPNGVKVTILFEELLEAGFEAEYDAWLVAIGKGTQFSSGFVDLNPNSKIPALLDRSGEAPVKVFESGSILFHLAEKFGAFLPESGAERTEVMNWLFWQMGSAPFLGGGFGHFYHYAPSDLKYPIDRYAMEVKRQLDVLDKLLAERQFITGDTYTIADMAIWPWYGQLVLGRLYNAAEFLDVESFTNVLRWAKQIDARPAVQRGRRVNRPAGSFEGGLENRNSAADFAIAAE